MRESYDSHFRARNMKGSGLFKGTLLQSRHPETVDGDIAKNPIDQLLKVFNYVPPLMPLPGRALSVPSAPSCLLLGL